jgi:hypothetical protein
MRKANNLPPSMGRLSRKCENLNDLQSYGLPWPVTGIVFSLYNLRGEHRLGVFQKRGQIALYVMKSTAFWVVAPCISVDVHGRF